MYFEANSMYFGATFKYFDATLGYFDATLKYFDATLVYFDATLGYLKSAVSPYYKWIKSSACGAISCFKMFTGEMDIILQPGHQGWPGLAW